MRMVCSLLALLAGCSAEHVADGNAPTHRPNIHLGVGRCEEKAETEGARKAASGQRQSHSAASAQSFFGTSTAFPMLYLLKPLRLRAAR